MITAAEIGAFVYCPEKWQLEYGQAGRGTIRRKGKGEEGQRGHS
jgi:hypothetical protein